MSMHMDMDMHMHMDMDMDMDMVTWVFLSSLAARSVQVVTVMRRQEASRKAVWVGSASCCSWQCCRSRRVD
jgi:hypothetical protein